MTRSVPKAKAPPPTPTSVRLGAETRALWAELAGWWEVSQSGALARAVQEAHAREAERRATRDRRRER